MSRLRVFLAVTGLAFLGVLGFALPVLAHHGETNTINCQGATLTFAEFADKPGNTVHIDALVDDKIVNSTDFRFDGPKGTTTVAWNIVGDHVAHAVAHWDTNGEQGSFDTGPVRLSCQTFTTTVTTEHTNTVTTEHTNTVTVTTPPPPPVTVTVTTPAPPPVTVTTTVPKLITKTKLITRYKTKVKYRTVVKWRNKACHCPPGEILFMWHGKYRCGIPGSG